MAKLEFTRSMFFTLEGSKKHCKRMRKGLSFFAAECLCTFARITISSNFIPFMAWSDTSISETSTRSVICLHCDAIELGIIGSISGVNCKWTSHGSRSVLNSGLLKTLKSMDSLNAGPFQKSENPRNPCVANSTTIPILWGGVSPFPLVLIGGGCHSSSSCTRSSFWITKDWNISLGIAYSSFGTHLTRARPFFDLGALNIYR